MSDDRSERLRQRRKQSQERARDGSDDEPGDSSERDEQSEPSATTEPDEGTETEAADDSSVKKEQVGTYMYLPQSQKKELERLYNVLKAEYEYEYDDQFEKNRAFYPLVVKYGFESLDSMDISEVRESLEKI